MGLLGLLFGKKKNVVLIPSRKKATSLRACNEIADCLQLCQLDCPQNTCGLDCPSNVQVAFVPEELSEKIRQQNSDDSKSLFFGGNDIDFKNSIVAIEGVKSVVFGKAICDNNEEYKCTYVSYDFNLTDIKSLIKIYDYLTEEKKLFFKSNEEKSEYNQLLKLMNIENVQLIQIKDFEN
jgi:hypothetical protein